MRLDADRRTLLLMGASSVAGALASASGCQRTSSTSVASNAAADILQEQLDATVAELTSARKQLDEFERTQRAETLTSPPIWSHFEFNRFLAQRTSEERLNLRIALHGNEEDVRTASFSTSEEEILAVQNQMLWVSSNIVEYQFKSSDSIEYHKVAQWAAQKMGVESWLVDTQSTFVIERAIMEALFLATWDSLTPDQRLQLLAKIDPDNKEKHLGIASLTGSTALATLSAAVYFSGFAFYTTMSVVMSTVAGWMGLTLPFAAYTSASSIIAVLSGPVGWALIAVGVAVGVTLLGRANEQRTVSAVIQIHAQRVQELNAIGDVPPRIFKPVGTRP